MITLLNLNIEGYCSIAEPTHINLNQGCIIRLAGPNGRGKSSIFGALVWCLYGKTIKGKVEVNTWKKYQPKDYKGTKVEVFYQTDQGVYKVIRCQSYKGILEDGAKGNNRLILFEEGNPLPIKGKVKIQEAIEHTLGLTYKLFMNSIMFGQGLTRLIQESNTDKKALFEEIFDLNFLNVARGIVKNDTNNLMLEVNKLKEQSNYLRDDIEKTKSTYLELRERERSWKATLHRERRTLRDKRKDLKKKYLKYKDKVSKDILNKVNTQIEDNQKRVYILKEDLAHARSLSKIPLEDLVEKIMKLMRKKDYTSAYSKLGKVHRAFKLINKYTQELEGVQENLYKLKDHRRELQSIRDTYDDIHSSILAINDKLKKLKSERLKVISPKYKKELHEYRKKLRKVDEDYHNKLLDLDDYEWLLEDPLSNHGIKAYLFDSSLDLLNKTLNGYADILGFRIEFNVDMDSTRKDFVTLIEKDGVIADYEELSGGEQQLCNLAMAFAMSEAMSAARGINITFLDEVFENLSEDNIEVVISLIKHIYEHKTLFLITHQKSLPLSNVKVWQVEKTNGLTSINPL